MCKLIVQIDSDADIVPQKYAEHDPFPLSPSSRGSYDQNRREDQDPGGGKADGIDDHDR